MNELEIDKLAIIYAMETDLPVKVVRDFCVLLCIIDGIKHLDPGDDGAIRAMWEACDADPAIFERTFEHKAALISRLKEANLIR